MDNNVLWSLRLGFSAKQAPQIKQLGIEKFLRQSFADKPDIPASPFFLTGEPKNNAELKADGEKRKADRATDVARVKQSKKNLLEFKGWWVGRMREEPFPLREKMTLFLHNHFVSTVTILHWLYDHNTVLRENAFGNFRELTKKMLYTNAMVKYLNNNANRKGNLNENLSRELLELFTIGIGNYTEQDIKNGAIGLAGLTTGDRKAFYNNGRESSEAFTYFGKKGNFKADEMVDIIFEQKNAPYHFTRKLLKWFIYDNPPESLVKYYGDYFREKDYEIQPLMVKIFTEEFSKPTAGSKIKDPLLFILHVTDELNIKAQSNKLLAFFARSQGMDLYKQVNVKGWDGGRSWLSSQTYQQRLNTCDILCKGANFKTTAVRNLDEIDDYKAEIDVRVDWSRKGNNKTVIAELGDRLLFTVDDEMQKNFETVLRHDFVPNDKNADNGVLRLFNNMVRTPEFQLI